MLRNFLVKSLACLAVALAASVAAAEETQDWRFGGDAYLAGRTVSATGENTHDLFAAGQHVTLGSPITGAAHLAGQNIVIGARVGGNLYAAGQDIDLDAPVAGAATLAGQALTIKGPISGNLRAKIHTFEVANSAVKRQWTWDGIINDITGSENPLDARTRSYDSDYDDFDGDDSSDVDMPVSVSICYAGEAQGAGIGLDANIAANNQTAVYHQFKVAGKATLPGYDFDAHVGGIFYLFIRGMRPELGWQSGVFHLSPGWLRRRIHV